MRLCSTPPDPIESEFDELQNMLEDIDAELDETKMICQCRFRAIEEAIQDVLETEAETPYHELNKCRQNYLDQLQTYLKNLFERNINDLFVYMLAWTTAQSGSQLAWPYHLDELIGQFSQSFSLNQQSLLEKMICFKPSTKSVEEEFGKFFGAIGVKNEFNLESKLKYMHFYNKFEEIDIAMNLGKSAGAAAADEDQLDFYNELKLIPLSRNRYFLFQRINNDNKKIMKIINKHGKTICQRQIKPELYYDGFIAYNNRILCTSYDFDLNKHQIELYDHHLQLVKSKQFDCMIKLVAMNSVEIVCYHNLTQNLVFFDYELRQTNTLDKQAAQLANFNVKVATDDSNIYLVYFDYGLRQVMMKSLSKRTNQLQHIYQLGSLLGIKSLNWIKFDSNLNVIIKYVADDSIKCFNKHGELVNETKAASPSTTSRHHRHLDLDLGLDSTLSKHGGECKSNSYCLSRKNFIKPFENLEMTINDDFYYFNVFKRKLYIL